VVDSDTLKMLIAIPFFLLILVVYVASVGWAYTDAQARGKSGCLVALLVAILSWPVGLLIWLVFRPDDRDRL
jgi:hypothetical protein